MKAVSASLGYPRIGANREWKRTLEGFWAGKLTEQVFNERLEEVRLGNWRRQAAKQLDLIPVNDFTRYDHMLDTAVMFGLIPSRFNWSGGEVPLATYYAMARGNATATACEMTKWFNTNYHYIVPELSDMEPVLTSNLPLEAYRSAKKELGISGRPVLVGPLTFLKLSKGLDSLAAWVNRLLPLYIQVLQELEEEGVQWVQMDEPVVVTGLSDDEAELLQAIYTTLHNAVPNLNIMLQTYFEAVERYETIVALPVQGIGLDFVHGLSGNLAALQSSGFPEDKVLGAGIIDGRGIWAADLQAKLTLLGQLKAIVPTERLVLQPSSSLLHTPVTTAPETTLGPVLQQAMAYADEKLDELVLLTRAVNLGADSVAGELAANAKALEALRTLPARSRSDVRAEVAGARQASSSRSVAFAARSAAQQARLQLPFLPTTTIGSFPQTLEVKQARQKWRKNEWSEEQYAQFIRDEIKAWIDIQEELDLDVLVHGEFERTDMVEFFGEKLDGFAFTANGWVQSYGSRCVKPPVIYGDVAFSGAMTVTETAYAQSLTKRPVKGMLTGPVTILNWSFVRDDLSREAVAYQIALAIRKEMEALEAAGIGLIQVDEPALREGLPLKRRDWEAYLTWAVDSFKVSTATMKPETQVHTHMCYSEFQDIIDAISAMDADVISIETSRSHGELIQSFEDYAYDKGIGLGVYDIHSPRVPTTAEMEGMIDRALRVIDASLFWVNPDCGLKTRRHPETVAALRNMVEATRSARVKYAPKA